MVPADGTAAEDDGTLVVRAQNQQTNKGVLAAEACTNWLFIVQV
jgi:hypothetical protein